MKKIFTALLLLLIFLSTISSVSLLSQGSGRKYLEYTEPIIDEYYGLASYTPRWLNDHIVGFYTSTYGYLTYVNVSSGEIKHLYVGKYMKWPIGFALVSGNKLFMIDFRGNASLIDLDKEEIIWSKGGYVSGLVTLINHRDRIVLANGSIVEIINPFDGQVRYRYNFSLIGTGMDYIVRSGFVVFRIVRSGRNDIIATCGIDSFGYDDRVLDDYELKIDYDPIKMIIAIKYSNGTIVLKNIITDKVLEVFDISYDKYAEITIDSRNHFFLIKTKYSIIKYSLEDLTPFYLYESSGYYYVIKSSPNERYLAIREHGVLTIVDIPTNTILYKVNTITPYIHSISWLSDDKLLIHGFDHMDTSIFTFYWLNGEKEYFNILSMDSSPLTFIDNNLLYLINNNYVLLELLVFDLETDTYVLRTTLNLTYIGSIDSLYFSTLVEDKIVIGFKSSSRKYIAVYDPGTDSIVDYFELIKPRELLGVSGDQIYLTLYDSQIYRVDLSDHSEELLLRTDDLLPTGYSLLKIDKDPGSDRIVAGIRGVDRNTSSFYVIDLNSKEILASIDLNYTFLGGIYWPENGDIVGVVKNAFVLIDPDNYNYTVIYSDIDEPVNYVETNPSQTYLAILSNQLFSNIKVYPLINTSRGGELVISNNTVTETTTLTIEKPGSTETIAETTMYTGEGIGGYSVSGVEIFLIILVIVLSITTIYLLFSRRKGV